jgi:hypothetical protein
MLTGNVLSGFRVPLRVPGMTMGWIQALKRSVDREGDVSGDEGRVQTMVYADRALACDDEPIYD